MNQQIADTESIENNSSLTCLLGVGIGMFSVGGVTEVVVLETPPKIFPTRPPAMLPKRANPTYPKKLFFVVNA